MNRPLSDLCGRKQLPFLLSVVAAGIRDWL
jgi:hypothetical protein